MRRTLALGALALLAGCAGQREFKTADIYYYSPHAPIAPEQAVTPPGVDVTNGMCIRVVDERRRTQVERWSLPKPQIRDWLVAGIESRLGIAVVYTDEPPDGGAYLALERLYIKHIATTMAGVTVLRAYGSEASRAVRGNMTRMNWNGTSREFSRLLSQSLDDAIAKLPLSAIVNRNCEPNSPTPPEGESLSLTDIRR